jgi:proteasome lid subunit RPN8/RPN11
MSSDCAPVEYLLQMNRTDYETIISHARDGLPNESCGLLAGRLVNGIKIVERIYCLTNTDESDQHFTIDPREQLAAVKDMRTRSLSPLGNFHSHPATPARPSAEDISLAHDPKASYVIASLAGDVPVVKSFHIENEVVTPEEIELQ